MHQQLSRFLIHEKLQILEADYNEHFMDGLAKIGICLQLKHLSLQFNKIIEYSINILSIIGNNFFKQELISFKILLFDFKFDNIKDLKND